MKKLTFFKRLSFILFSLSFSNLLFAQNFQFINSIPAINGKLLSFSFPTKDTGFVVGGNGIILMTSDTGNTWSLQNSNTTQYLRTVCFVNSHTGWAIGDSATIIKTTNGGSTWFSQYYSYLNFSYYYSASFIDSDTGYICGDSYNTVTGTYYGLVLKTTDGGNNWIIKLSKVNRYFVSIYFISPAIGFALSNDSLYKTSDYGDSWHTVYNNNFYYGSISFPSLSVGYISGPAGILKTTDSGNNWNLVNTQYYADYLNTYFTSADTGYFVGSSTSGDALPQFIGSTILKTTDGGISLDSLTNVAAGYELNSVCFPDKYHAFICGDWTGGPGSWGYLGPIILLKSDMNINTSIKVSLNDLFLSCFIYPNPSNGLINIKFPFETENITIFNEIGQVILKRFVKNQTSSTFEISERGVYFVRIVTEKETVTKKLIIEN